MIDSFALFPLNADKKGPREALLILCLLLYSSSQFYWKEMFILKNILWVLFAIFDLLKQPL